MSGVDLDPIVADIAELVAIESVSTTPGYERELERAASWAVSRIERMGGQASVLRPNGKPLVVGEVAASSNASDARDVLA